MEKYTVKIECEQKDLIDVLKQLIDSKKIKFISCTAIDNKTLYEFGVIPDKSWTWHDTGTSNIKLSVDTTGTTDDSEKGSVKK